MQVVCTYPVYEIRISVMFTSIVLGGGVGFRLSLYAYSVEKLLLLSSAATFQKLLF